MSIFISTFDGQGQTTWRASAKKQRFSRCDEWFGVCVEALDFLYTKEMKWNDSIVVEKKNKSINTNKCKINIQWTQRNISVNIILKVQLFRMSIRFVENQWECFET